MEHVANKYGLLFWLNVHHSWFQDNVCPYISLEPDEATKVLFRKMHILSMYSQGVLRVKARVAEGEEKKEDSKKYHFIFLLKSSDYKFFEITNLDVSGYPAKAFYFTNALKSQKLKFDRCNVTDRYFNIEFESGKTPSKIKIKTQDNIEIYNDNVQKGSAFFKYDMARHSTGLYTAITSLGKSEQKHTLFYYSPFIRKDPILGVIDIYTEADAELDADKKKTFLLQFEATKNET